jgi:hypothetical protein
LHAEFALELADGRGQSRLRDVHSLGGPSEVQRFGDAHEVPQVPEFGHSAS